MAGFPLRFKDSTCRATYLLSNSLVFALPQTWFKPGPKLGPRGRKIGGTARESWKCGHKINYRWFIPNGAHSNFIDAGLGLVEVLLCFREAARWSTKSHDTTKNSPHFFFSDPNNLDVVFDGLWISGKLEHTIMFKLHPSCWKKKST